VAFCNKKRGLKIALKPKRARFFNFLGGGGFIGKAYIMFLYEQCQKWSDKYLADKTLKNNDVTIFTECSNCSLMNRFLIFALVD